MIRYTLTIQLILSTLLAVIATNRLISDDLPPLSAADGPQGVSDSTEAAGVPSWGLGPFVRCPENPLIMPRSDVTFFCPILKQNVPWEAKNIVGAAAAPRMPYELNSAVGAPVCFMEGLVRFKGKWLLYYEAGDHVGAIASCDQPGFETSSK